MKYGDILKYREGETTWRFMFIAQHQYRDFEFHKVLVLTIEPDDDEWTPGETILTSGINEMVLVDD
jgi:hypothetical protein